MEKTNIAMDETPLELNTKSQIPVVWNMEISNMIQKEVMKFMKNHNMNVAAWCVDFSSFKGKNSNYYSLNSEKNSGIWIVGIGATAHMCHDLNLLSQYTKPKHNLSVSLLDGSTQPILYIGTVT